MNVQDHQESTTALARIAPGLVGFLHFFTLGAALPLLPLYLTRTLGYSWTVAGIILTTIPCSLLIAQFIVRRLSDIGVDSRLGLSLHHLLAAGTAIAARMYLPSPNVQGSDWRWVMALIALYFICLMPAMTWIAQVGDGVSQAGRSVIRSWRVWGAAGFVAPAWLVESVLIRFSELVPGIESHEIQFLIAGWAGLATAFAAILLPESDSERSSDPEPADEDRSGPGKLMVLATVLLVVVQRGHYMGNAPFFQSVLERYEVERLFVYRLTVSDQVFELFGLFILGTGFTRFGPRLMLVAGASAWLGRSLLSGWMSQSLVSGKIAMACLFGSQVLHGIAVVMFFGTLGVVLRIHYGTKAIRRHVMLAAIVGIPATLISGLIADVMLAPNSTQLILHGLNDFGLSGIVDGENVLWLRGWTGIWWLSAIPCFLATILVSLARQPELNEDTTL